MKIVNGEGILKPKIAIVGEAPGQIEEALGKPFVGPSGKLLNSVLDELGIDREDCYITNAVKFRPPGNRTPTDEEIMHWRSSLLEELYAIDPKIIVTLGAVATKALFNCGEPGDQLKDVKITKIRGTIEFNEYAHLHFIPTLHPSYCLRNPKETDKLREDFKKALEYAK
jgi:uracil-DNA glycosylase